MKSFFKTFLATLLAFVAGSGCLVFVVFSSLMAAIAGLATFGSNRTPVELKANTVLKIDLSSLDEIVSEDPFAGLMRGKEGSEPVSLTTAIRAIGKAKNNPNIEAIYLNLDNISIGMAAADELRRALIDFKLSGKPIFSYSDTYSQKSYYISSVADRVILNPLGSVAIVGIAANNLMLKGALDKFGVKMETFRVGTFKSAVEPFMLREMSEANRRQTQEYVDGLWGSIVSGIAEARKLDPQDIRNFADSGAAFSASERFVELGLVDTLAYRSSVTDVIAQRIGVEADKMRMISLADMAELPESTTTTSKNKVSVIYAEGEITDAEGSIYTSGVSYITSDLIDKLRKAKQDEAVKAVVLRVNSPGGSAFLSEQIWHEMVELKKKKPVVVSMGNLAASGGYYIAAPASAIIAEQNTLTGSIGIFAYIANLSKVVSDFGLNLDIVKTSKYAELGTVATLMKPMTDDQRQLIQTQVERGYEIFLARVGEGRDMTRDQVDSIGQGRVWLGSKALELGLVDKLGGLQTAIEEAVSLANLNDYSVDYGTTRISFFEDLFGSVAKSSDFVAKIRYQFMTEQERTFYRMWQASTEYAGLHARLPYEFNPY